MGLNNLKQERKELKIILMQPNFQILGKRSWKLIPYNLCLLKACCKDKFDIKIYDPNFNEESEEEIKKKLIEFNPDVIGLTTFSTEYIDEIKYHSKFIRKILPKVILILGGTLPTVWIEKIINCRDIDYFVMGEGEIVFKKLLEYLTINDINEILKLKNVAANVNGQRIINDRSEFIDNLDNIPYPDYSDLNFHQYGTFKHKYAHTILPMQTPYAISITSRGCPMKCTFCAARTVSGNKVRLRSAENVLEEIRFLKEEYGINEIIFLDDHFLYNRKRAIDIMQGIIERFNGLTWKCVNVAVFSLDEDILKLMLKSGCNQITLSIESGDEEVLKKLIKKPVNLKKAKVITKIAKKLGFEVVCNFVIGTPGESWEQIRKTFCYAEKLNIDLCNFHIATPLPKTELMQICIDKGLLQNEDEISGYTVGSIDTLEFTGFELQVLRAFEWDRINFSSKDKINKIANLEGVTFLEIEEWRRFTRRELGKTNKQFRTKA